MDNTKTIETFKEAYSKRFHTIKKRISSALEESQLQTEDLNLPQMRDFTDVIIDIETQTLKSDVEALLKQKEMIEREIEKKSDALQEKKYEIFNDLEEVLADDKTTLLKLHQVKLQSIDLYDILSETVESAVISALEKEDSDADIEEYISEVVKDITYESIKEGSLNTIRVRKILSTILVTSIDIAEATPNRAKKILTPTLKGMRSGLIKSIDRFKKRLEFMPMEAKHILIEDYDTIIEDLNQTDTLFSQVVATQAGESSNEIRILLTQLNKDMAYDLEELMHISKETANIMRDRFSTFAKSAVKKADVALSSPKAQEAKRMGIQAFEVAKVALGSAIKTAKDAIDKK